MVDMVHGDLTQFTCGRHRIGCREWARSRRLTAPAPTPGGCQQGRSHRRPTNGRWRNTDGIGGRIDRARVASLWFTACSGIVHGWFTAGSRLVHVWFMCGSCLVHGGSLLVHSWFIDGSLVVHGWFAGGSLVLH